MDDAESLRPLLEEIRDLSREQLEAYREQSERSLRIAEEAVARQATHLAFYKKVVIGGVILIAVLIVGLLFLRVFVG